MNEKIEAYQFNPAEDEMIFGDMIREGFKILIRGYGYTADKWGKIANMRSTYNTQGRLVQVLIILFEDGSMDEARVRGTQPVIIKVSP